MRAFGLIGALTSVLALSACGGSSSTSSVAGDEIIDEVVVVNNLVRASGRAPLATDESTVEQLLENTDAVFRPVTAGLRVSDGIPALSNAGSVKAITQDDNGNFRVVYSVDGVDQRVIFRPRDQDPDFGDYTRVVDGVEFIADELELEETSLDYIAFFYAGRAAEERSGFLSLGAIGPKTAVADLPVGTARYDGSVGASLFSDGSGGDVEASALQGDFTMTANFDRNRVTGNFRNIMAEAEDETVSSLRGRVLLRGDISGNGFSGRLAEADTVAGSELEGFVGAFEGDFYGPAAEEAGGVFNGNTTDGGIVIGAFGGAR